jgi:hypothetical protein
MPQSKLLDCFIETLEGFHTLADGELIRLPPSKKTPNT